MKSGINLIHVCIYCDNLRCIYKHYRTRSDLFIYPRTTRSGLIGAAVHGPTVSWSCTALMFMDYRYSYVRSFIVMNLQPLLFTCKRFVACRATMCLSRDLARHGKHHAVCVNATYMYNCVFPTHYPHCLHWTKSFSFQILHFFQCFRKYQSFLDVRSVCSYNDEQ